MEILSEGFGYDGESLARVLRVQVDIDLINCDIYLEFEKPQGRKLVSDILTLVDGVCEYYLPNECLDETGYLKIQVIAKDGNTFIKKSAIYNFYVSKSINATENMITEFNDVISGLQNSKADNIQYANNILQLTANELPIGNAIEIASGGASDYNDLENQPITIITNMDGENPYNLRSLESGLYRLHGYFKPYESYEGRFTVPAPLFVSLFNNGTSTHMQMYFAYNNMVQYYVLTDENYTNTNCRLSQMVEQIADLQERVAALENA